MRTTIKTTSELNNGDTVMHYGVPFVISNKRESAFHKDIGFGKVYVFDTQELPNDKSDDCFPLHWRTDYKIQGNDIATWAVIATCSEYKRMVGGFITKGQAND